jgi:hypothetical protein
VQQVAEGIPDALVPVQQVVPGSQQDPAVAPFDPVMRHVWVFGQHVPPRHNPEQHSLSAEQVLPPVVQQDPPAQLSPAWHALPQPPQLFALVLVSIQEPVQQVWPEGQAVPQVPQLLASVFVSTQVPLQTVWPVGHWTVHTPF